MLNAKRQAAGRRSFVPLPRGRRSFMKGFQNGAAFLLAALLVLAGSCWPRAVGMQPDKEPGHGDKKDAADKKDHADKKNHADKKDHANGKGKDTHHSNGI